jgi:transcriptional regulator with XRE-family HTH domain
MGRSRRPRPTHLASKLLQIRLSLGLTQQQMFERLNYQQSPLLPPRISDFELGKREPPLQLLLAYARTVGISLETLADDEIVLPTSIPSKTRPS